jgi:hypothetical protein
VSCSASGDTTVPTIARAFFTLNTAQFDAAANPEQCEARLQRLILDQPLPPAPSYSYCRA